ncbi:MAG TPA: YigZ family protein [Flavobacteriaceae bacterium]|nr:YigZ family protein [Flavobacteriaceae bacterium]
MEPQIDFYKTISNPSEGLIYKEKGSKFLGFTFPISDEEDVKLHLATLKKQHHAARHWCYAWQIGIENIQYRVNDDGEPHNSAGQPIYGQIQSFNLTNILVVVVRYFGGTKLGVGGLISAYKTAAQFAVEASEIVEKLIEIKFKIIIDYQNLNKIMRFVKEHQLNIVSQNMDIDCVLILSIRKSESKKYDLLFSALHYLKSVEKI